MHNHVSAGEATYSAVSSGAVTSIRIQNDSGNYIFVQCTMDNVAPTSDDGAFTIWPGDILDSGRLLSTLFAGVGAGPYYVWAKVKTAPRDEHLSVSHA